MARVPDRAATPLLPPDGRRASRARATSGGNGAGFAMQSTHSSKEGKAMTSSCGSSRRGLPQRASTASSRDLPRARRRELTEEIAGHIAEGRAGLRRRGRGGVRELLERLGDPAEIAAEARGVPSLAAPAGWMEILALIRLLIGGIVLPVSAGSSASSSSGCPTPGRRGRSSWGRSSSPAASRRRSCCGGLAVTAETARRSSTRMTGAEISSSCTGGSFRLRIVLGPVLAWCCWSLRCSRRSSWRGGSAGPAVTSRARDPRRRPRPRRG